MPECTESEMRITAFNRALDTFDQAKQHCTDLARDARRAADALEKPQPAPAQNRLGPPPMPNEMRPTKLINFPTEAQINDAINARSAAQDALVTAWDALTTKDRTRVVPPEGLYLQNRRVDG